MRCFRCIPTCGASVMAEIDPDRFALRPVDALREAYAQVMDELDLVKELLGAASDAQRASDQRVRVDACLWLTAPRVQISTLDGDKA